MCVCLYVTVSVFKLTAVSEHLFLRIPGCWLRPAVRQRLRLAKCLVHRHHLQRLLTQMRRLVSIQHLPQQSHSELCLLLRVFERISAERKPGL